MAVQRLPQPIVGRDNLDAGGVNSLHRAFIIHAAESVGTLLRSKIAMGAILILVPSNSPETDCQPSKA